MERNATTFLNEIVNPIQSNFCQLSDNAIMILFSLLIKNGVFFLSFSEILLFYLKYLLKIQPFSLNTEYCEKSLYHPVSLGCISENISNGRSYVGGNVDISHCFFKRTSTYIGDGGVVYIINGEFSMKIYFSMFYLCGCSQKGGAILFNSKDSSLSLICVNRCSAQYSIFADIKVTNNNIGEFISLSLSSHVTTSNYWSFVITGGTQTLNNMNSSMNSAVQVSGLYVYIPLSFSSSFCTFSNDIVSNNVCIYLQGGSGTMKYGIFVHNNSPTLGIFHIAGVYKLHYCIFDMNQDILFSYHSGSLEVSHSFISFYCNAINPIPIPSPDKPAIIEQTILSSPYQTPNMTYQNKPMTTHEVFFGDLFHEMRDFYFFSGAIVSMIMD